MSTLTLKCCSLPLLGSKLPCSQGMHGLGSSAGSHRSEGGFKSTHPFLLSREGNPKVAGWALSLSVSK